MPPLSKSKTFLDKNSVGGISKTMKRESEIQNKNSSNSSMSPTARKGTVTYKLRKKTEQ